jgi:cytochrome c-type biogenesis protein CcmE
MKAKFRKGQRVVCTHYKDRPVVIVDEVLTKQDQLWVRSTITRKGQSDYWYGPLNWFKPK